MPLQEGRFIESISYITPEQVPTLPIYKNSIVDVKCKDNYKRYFVVEMQNSWTPEFKYRVLYNTTKAYSRQLKKGQLYETLMPVYALNLVDDKFSRSKNYYHHYTILNVTNLEDKIDGIEMVFIELPNFKAQSISQKKMHILWLRFLTEIRHGTINIPVDLVENKHTRKALDILEESSFSKGEIEAYDKYWDGVSRERYFYGYKNNVV